MRIRPNIYLTSDTHFGHSKLYTEWNHREEGFEDELVIAWNSVIQHQDVVLHLGDLTMTSKDKTLEWTSQLKGRKYLVRGNHDGHSDGWYRDVGFEVIPASIQRFGQKDDTYMNLMFTHEPVTPLPVGWFNIHGHLHGDNHRGIKTSNEHLDVGVDSIGMKPIKLSDILGKIKK